MLGLQRESMIILENTYRIYKNLDSPVVEAKAEARGFFFKACSISIGSACLFLCSILYVATRFKLSLLQVVRRGSSTTTPITKAEQELG